MCMGVSLSPHPTTRRSPCPHPYPGGRLLPGILSRGRGGLLPVLQGAGACGWGLLHTPCAEVVVDAVVGGISPSVWGMCFSPSPLYPAVSEAVVGLLLLPVPLCQLICPHPLGCSPCGDGLIWARLA